MRSLIDKLGLSFSYSATHGAYRMGGANRNAVYPRPIKWFLTTRQQKAEILQYQQYKLKDNDVFKKVRLVNDYDEEELLEHREASQLSGMANRQGINARVKGKAVVIDGKVYSRDLFGFSGTFIVPVKLLPVCTER